MCTNMVRQLWPYAVAFFAAIFAFAKRKVISATLEKAKVSASNKFWSWLSGKVAPTQKNNGRTYKGTFQGYFEYANYPRECYFEVIQDGVETKVPVSRTNLLSGVQPGILVEIDTEVVPGFKFEVIMRVRKRQH